MSMSMSMSTSSSTLGKVILPLIGVAAAAEDYNLLKEKLNNSSNAVNSNNNEKSEGK